MSKRLYIIGLMMASVDGKILGHTWGDSPKVAKLIDKYEQTHDAIGIGAWIVGRSTMEMNFTSYQEPVHKETDQTFDRSDFVANSNAGLYAIAIDGSGKLGWISGKIENDHVITILTKAVPDSYLANLRDMGVSYIFAGKDEIDLHVAMEKLVSLFGIKKLMLEGGGHINGSFLNEGLVDEYHHLLLPIVDGRKDTSTAFEISEEDRKYDSTLLTLKEFRCIEDDVLWLIYDVQKQVDKR